MAKKKDPPKFKPSKAAEREFERQLKKVARHAGQIVEEHARGAKLEDGALMMKRLQKYADVLGPWAQIQSEKLLARVSRSNYAQYRKESKQLGRLLRRELAEPSGSTGAPVANPHVGKVTRALINEQVELIKSLPLEAGLRAQKIAEESFLNGARAVPDPEVVDRLKEEMGMSTEVAVNRAKLIARTEAARANAAFMEARATSIGVTHYRWRAAMDGATTRHSHAKMNGKVVAYDNPPTLSDGTRGHAGTFPNCRCWQDPILPD